MNVRYDRSNLIDNTSNLINTGYTREQKRKLMKMLHVSKNEIDMLTKPQIEVDMDVLEEGTEVKLNVERIMESSNNKSELYMDFVIENRNKVFTVFQDENHKGSTLYCLNEDPAPDGAKWLFDISDLIPQIELSDLEIKDFHETTKISE